MRLKDLSGERFGSLTVIDRAPNLGKKTAWNVRCDCGSEKRVRGEAITRGDTVSCGCHGVKARRDSLTTHGMSGTKEYEMLCQAKKRSKKKGLSFNLEISDIQIPERCPLLGIEIWFSGQVQTAASPSLDRINSALGYVKGNVWVISHRANTIKSNATLEEIELLASNLRANNVN
jgi:hypothetical protein